MIYVMLLRGINAGGARRVEMARLKIVLEQSGLGNVETYINSGNVIFASRKAPAQEKIDAALAAEFGFDIPTLIISSDDFLRIADAIPHEWGNDYDLKNGWKSDVAYLFPAVDDTEILTAMGYQPEVETLIYEKGAVLSNLSRKNQPKSSLARLIGKPLYRQMTVRNVTTARKLAEMVRSRRGE
jgi:uncharacterized protein (DUF1697 family)